MYKSLTEMWRTRAVKRFALVAAFLIPSMIMALLIFHNHYEAERFRGLATDLKPIEVEDALNILVAEREMWAGFTRLSGHATVTLERTDKENLVLDGDISLLQTGFDNQHLWAYVMVFSNKLAGWTVKTDGTEANTKINCQNKEVGATIDAIDPTSILQILVFPKFALVPLFKDELFRQGNHTAGQLIGFWNPWRTTNELHSYTFKPSRSSDMADISFANGHFSSFQKGNILGSYQKPVESNRFWFPSDISFYARGIKYYITLSDVTVNKTRNN